MPVVSLTATAAVVLRGFLAERSLVAALTLVLVSLGFGVALADASLGHEGRLETDILWALTEVLGWFLALAHGAGLVGHPGVLGSFALARPVSAGLLLFGRFLGLAAGLFLYVAAVTVVLLGWLSLSPGGVGIAPLCMGWLLWLRLVVVLAVSTLLLALARPTVAAPLAAALSVAGWFVGSFPAASGPLVLKPLSGLATFLLPDLPALDAPLRELPGRFSEAGLLLAGPTLYGALYAAAMVAAAIAVFPWRARRPPAPTA